MTAKPDTARALAARSAGRSDRPWYDGKDPRRGPLINYVRDVPRWLDEAGAMEEERIGKSTRPWYRKA